MKKHRPVFSVTKSPVLHLNLLCLKNWEEHGVSFCDCEQDILMTSFHTSQLMFLPNTGKKNVYCHGISWIVQ